MTKVQAEKEFRNLIFWEPSLRMDRIMVRCAWNDYTDALCKEGRITSKQYETWSNPFK